MQVPDEFRRFAAGFYQGSSADFSDMQLWIDSALGRLDTAEKRTLKKFLDDLLDGNLDEAALQRVWNDTPADYYVTAHGSVRGFFQMISETIGKQLPK
jgi:hypothetical protein